MDAGSVGAGAARGGAHASESSGGGGGGARWAGGGARVSSSRGDGARGGGGTARCGRRCGGRDAVCDAGAVQLVGADGPLHRGDCCGGNPAGGGGSARSESEACGAWISDIAPRRCGGCDGCAGGRGAGTAGAVQPLGGDGAAVGDAEARHERRRSAGGCDGSFAVDHVAGVAGPGAGYAAHGRCDYRGGRHRAGGRSIADMPAVSGVEAVAGDCG